MVIKDQKEMTQNAPNYGPQDPIAIVGLGARLPGGANSPQQFWDLLLKNYDAISTIPKDRWDARYFHDPENLGLVGKTIQDKGGFLKDWPIDEFDVKFFSISPREAKSLDPNQRLLLEVAYETFEDAGVTLQQINGSKTGVFVGISATDYSHLQFPDINTIDVHTQTGVSTSINANRISYFYNLTGPSFIVDTACSSTLVALNCACQSIRSRESDAALCGAVNLMIYPEISVGFSKLGVLTPDGHCKAFDADANGYVRAEGAGMVMLKRLEDAEKDGNRILAVIRGTHVGSDGHFQQQMTSPSEEQQAMLLREIIAKSALQPSDIGYVESHGTGTFVGDPIECRSLSSVLNVGRMPNEPILIGSNKSNIGHMEPAAGIASLIKMTFALKYHTIPATISVKKTNPNIDLNKLHLEICTKNRPFPHGRSKYVPRTGIISAFGFGGTNGGAVIQEYVGGKGLIDVPSGLPNIAREEILLLSAKSVDALKLEAKNLASYLSLHSSAPLAHIAYTLACHRTQFTQSRIAIVAHTKDQAVHELLKFADPELYEKHMKEHHTEEQEDELDAPTPASSVQRVFSSLSPSEKRRPIIVVFAGQGAHWYAMGRSLYKDNVVFRTWMDKIDILFREVGLPYSIIEEINSSKENSKIEKTNVMYVQPAFYAIQVCVYKVMEASGMKADMFIGHSIGEIAAAHCSGALSIEDATKVCYERAKAQSECSNIGFMASVTSEENVLREVIADYSPNVDIAGFNAPNRFNISGAEEDINKLIEACQDREDIRIRRLLVNEPMHSRYIEMKRDQLINNLKDIRPMKPTIPVISTYKPFVDTTYSGQKPFASYKNNYSPKKEPESITYDGRYWYESLRQPVRFMDSVKEAVRRLSNKPNEDNDNNENEESKNDNSDNENKDMRETEYIFVECGPHNVFRTFLNEILHEDNIKFIYVPTLLRSVTEERLLILRSVANLYSLGFSLNLRKSLFIPNGSYDVTSKRILEEADLSSDFSEETALALSEEYPNGRRGLEMNDDYKQFYFVPDLPHYAWARTKECWNESPVQRSHRLGPEDHHPIVRVKLDCVNPTFQSDISTSHIPWVCDHCLQGNIVVPGVTFVESILTCGKKVFGDRPFWLRNVHFKNAFYMNKGEVMRVNISLDPIHKQGSRSAAVTAYNVSLSSRVLPKGDYNLNCTVVIETEDEIYEREKEQLFTSVPGVDPDFKVLHPNEAFEKIDMEAYRKLCPYEVPVDKFFADLWHDGLELRRQLRLCRKIWINDKNNPLISFAYVELNPETTEEEMGRWGFMYPPMLDSCLQSGLSAREKRGAFFPVEAERARFCRPFPKDKRHVWSLCRKDPNTGRLSMTCMDDDGTVYGSLQDVLIRYLEAGSADNKKNKTATLGMIGGSETPIFEHVWEFVKDVPTDYSQYLLDKILDNTKKAHKEKNEKGENDENDALLADLFSSLSSAAVLSLYLKRGDDESEEDYAQRVEEENNKKAQREHIYQEMLEKFGKMKLSNSLFSAPSTFVEKGLKMENDVAREFGATNIINNIVPLSNQLTYAIILGVFRNDYCLWKEETRKQAKDHSFTPCLDIAKEAHIRPFYYPHFLLCCRYLSDAKFLEFRHISGKSEDNMIENFEIRPTEKFFLSDSQTNAQVLSDAKEKVEKKRQENKYKSSISDEPDLIDRAVEFEYLPDDESPVKISEHILNEYPQMRPSVTFMMDVGRKMKTVIVDGNSPVPLIFKDKGLADAVYRDDGEVRTYNYVAQGIMAELLKDRENRLKNIYANATEEEKENLDESLNILEIGAGTGGTSAYLLELVADGQSTANTTYTYTDISQTFFPAAKHKFQTYESFMKYQVLNIELDPACQGFLPHSQDIIIAANVVHATQDLNRTLTHILSLLKPGGYLILLEALQGLRWLDIVFGLTEGWWAVTDRPFRYHPLLTPEKWYEALKKAGFAESYVFSQWKDDKTGAVIQGRVGVPIAQAPLTVPKIAKEVKEKMSAIIDKYKEHNIQLTPSQIPTMARTNDPASTAVLFVEDKNIVSGRLISSLLRDGHAVLAAIRGVDNGRPASKLSEYGNDSSKLLEILTKNTMTNEERSSLGKHFYSFILDNCSTSRKGYDDLFKVIVDKDLPQVVSIVHNWSLDLEGIAHNDDQIKNSFELNVYSPVYLTHTLIDLASSSEDARNGEKNNSKEVSNPNEIVENFDINDLVNSSSSSDSKNRHSRVILSSHLTTWAVTNGVWAAEGGVLRENRIGLGQQTVWGLNRCILNEVGSIHPRGIDLSIVPTSTEILALTSIIATTAFDGNEKILYQEATNLANPPLPSSSTLPAPSPLPANSPVLPELVTVNSASPSQTDETLSVIPLNETEIAVRGNKVYGQRLVQHQFTDSLSVYYKTVPTSNEDSKYNEKSVSYALTTPRAHQLYVEERARPAVLPEGEVEVHVAAAGLVYRDVMMWSGTLPVDARQGSNIGLEFAGVVERVGEGVTNVKPGDRVFGVGRECLAAYPIVHSTNVAKVPDFYSMDQLGGLGLELITAYYSLVIIGRMKKGDYVLIHAAAGGVGLCALQLCKIFGAIPISTSRTESKRHFLRMMGIENVISCETTAFTRDVLKITKGHGADIVLNSIPGQKNIHAGLASLAPGGRFVEIGKVDLFTGTNISLLPLTRNISYNVVAIDQMIMNDDKSLGPVFEACSKLLFEHKFIPLPITTFPLTSVEDAFNYFKEGKHMGKIVISPVSFSFTESAVPQERNVVGLISQGGYLIEDGTYLVTAGTQGFSFELAVGLLDRGAKHLAVCSRSGKGDAARQAKFENLRKKYNAQIEVYTCDSSSREQTEKMLDDIRAHMPPLHGIIHGAMLLHDGYLMNLDHKAFWEVLGPKSFGAWILHDNTYHHHDPLDFFILLSSLNAVVGTHGQANYAAANMFLDGLVIHRRSLGLPAMSLQWGVLQGVGYVHRNSTTIGANMQHFGFAGFSHQWANRMLHTCIEADADVEKEHVGSLPPKWALSSSLAQKEADTYLSLPRGLLPYSLRPQNEERIKSHFFEGANHLNNIREAGKVFKFPVAVPITVGVYNVKWEPLFEFMSGIKNVGRFIHIHEDMQFMSKGEGKKESKSSSDDKGIESIVSSSSSSSSSGASGAESNSTIAEQLRQIISEEEALKLLAVAIAHESARVLGISAADSIALDVPLSQYGLDSLTAVEMKNWTEKQVMVDIPVVDFVRGPSSDQLSRSMLNKFYEKFGRPQASGAKKAEGKEESHTTTSSSSTSESALLSEADRTRENIEARAAAAKEMEEQQHLLEEGVHQKRKAPLTAYVFTGQSGLKKGVGMDIYEKFPKAKEIWDRCDAYFLQELGVSLLKIIRENPTSYKVDFTKGEEGRILREKYMNLKITDDENVMKEVNDPNINARAFPMVNPDTDSYTFRSPNGLLNMTHFAQPIIIIYEYVALSCLRDAAKESEGLTTTSSSSSSSSYSSSSSSNAINRSYFSGHSLGEYCALTALGNIAPAQEMAMVCFIRGMVMQSCVQRDPITQMTEYAMAAVSPMRVAGWFKVNDMFKVIEMVVNACGGRLLQIVNYNVYNDQYVVSGERYAIWQLSMALTYLSKEGEQGMKDIATFCYQNIIDYPYSSRPVEIPRSTAVMQLKGIDMPFHSRVLRKVVPLFRSFLDSRLPTCKDYDYATSLVGKYITNIYAKELFSLNTSFVRKVINISGSPYLTHALGCLADENANEILISMNIKAEKDVKNPSPEEESSLPKEQQYWYTHPQWLSMSRNEKARLLLRECLSYQFASPVQWIDCQNTLMRHGILRYVEIGPSKTLSTMFPKSVLRLKEEGEEGASVAAEMRVEQAKNRSVLIKANEERGHKTDNNSLHIASPEQSGGVLVLSFDTDREILENIAKEEEN